MARHEDETEPIVRNVIPGRLVNFGSADHKGDLGVLARQRLVPAEQVDGPSLGDGHEPRARIAWNALVLPLLEGVDQGFLGEFLAQADVAYVPSQTGHQPAELQAENRLNSGGRIGGRHATDSTT